MIATLTQPLTLSEKRRLLKRTARRGNVQEKILKEPSLLIVDLFCGAGGVTTGFALSGIAKILACINHDHNATDGNVIEWNEFVNMQVTVGNISM